MKTIGVIANCSKPDTRATLERLLKKADEFKATLVSCDDSCEAASGIERVSSEEMATRIDLLIALGGDGTMLRAIRLLGENSIPVLGVNMGGLGFMTSIPASHLEKALDILKKGSYSISSRSLLACSVLRGGVVQETFQALNDIAIGWGESPRVITLGVEIDGDEVTSYVCDGLILSTPTGSTGHSLSGGGPILHPDAAAFVLTPIFPHTLSNRPLVISDESTISVVVEQTSKALLLAVDGQAHHSIVEGDHIEMKKSANTAQLIHLPDYNYFSLLRQKLHWRGSVLA